MGVLRETVTGSDGRRYLLEAMSRARFLTNPAPVGAITGEGVANADAGADQPVVDPAAGMLTGLILAIRYRGQWTVSAYRAGIEDSHRGELVIRRTCRGGRQAAAEVVDWWRMQLESAPVEGPAWQRLGDPPVTGA